MLVVAFVVLANVLYSRPHSISARTWLDAASRRNAAAVMVHGASAVYWLTSRAYADSRIVIRAGRAGGGNDEFWSAWLHFRSDVQNFAGAVRCYDQQKEKVSNGCHFAGDFH